MQTKPISRVIECPKCKVKLTIGLSADFRGHIRLYCNQCRQMIIDWNKTHEQRKTAQIAMPEATQKNLVMTSEYTAGQPNAETSYRISAPQPQQENVNDEFHRYEGQNKQEKIGEYRLLKKIGQGAMGEIFLAEHLENKNQVAIKLLSEEMQKDNQAIERFLQEAKVHSRLSRLVHPNIVGIYDVGYCAGTSMLYLVMEYVDGESLENILNNRGAISPKHSLKIAIAVAHALEHALEQHIIHRDLKPGNILIDRRTRRVKVADLGLGKIAEEKGATLSGQMMGTPYYMPPEQIKSAKDVDHRADIYALGATLYHMLTGRPPYSEYKGTLAIVRSKIYRDPVPVQEYASSISNDVCNIVERSMARGVDARYGTPTEMVKDMQQALEQIQ